MSVIEGGFHPKRNVINKINKLPIINECILIKD